MIRAQIILMCFSIVSNNLADCQSSPAVTTEPEVVLPAPEMTSSASTVVQPKPLMAHAESEPKAKVTYSQKDSSDLGKASSDSVERSRWRGLRKNEWSKFAKERSSSAAGSSHDSSAYKEKAIKDHRSQSKASDKKEWSKGSEGNDFKENRNKMEYVKDKGHYYEKSWSWDRETGRRETSGAEGSKQRQHDDGSFKEKNAHYLDKHEHAHRESSDGRGSRHQKQQWHAESADQGMTMKEQDKDGWQHIEHWYNDDGGKRYYSDDPSSDKWWLSAKQRLDLPATWTY